MCQSAAIRDGTGSNTSGALVEVSESLLVRAVVVLRERSVSRVQVRSDVRDRVPALHDQPEEPLVMRRPWFFCGLCEARHGVESSLELGIGSYSKSRTLTPAARRLPYALQVTIRCGWLETKGGRGRWLEHVISIGLGVKLYGFDEKVLGVEVWRLAS